MSNKVVCLGTGIGIHQVSDVLEYKRRWVYGTDLKLRDNSNYIPIAYYKTLLITPDDIFNYTYTDITHRLADTYRLGFGYNKYTHAPRIRKPKDTHIHNLCNPNIHSFFTDPRLSITRVMRSWSSEPATKTDYFRAGFFSMSSYRERIAKKHVRKGYAFTVGHGSVFVSPISNSRTRTSPVPYVLACIGNNALHKAFYTVSSIRNLFEMDKFTYWVDRGVENMLIASGQEEDVKEMHKFLKEIGATVKYSELPLFDEFFTKQTFPRFKSVIELRKFKESLQRGLVERTPIEDKFKPVLSKSGSELYREAINQINNSRVVKKMITVNIKKSSLATLLGLGKSIAEISKETNIPEEDVRNAAIKFGLVKTRKKVSNYIVNLEEDI